MFNTRSHRRYNPLTNQWILVSPRRTKRPWQGRREPVPKFNKPAYDPDCYMCPGNKRAHGQKNPLYRETYVFPNDFSPIQDSGQKNLKVEKDIFQAHTVEGECRVLCFSPRHDLTLAQMTQGHIEEVINTWIKELAILGHKYQWVQIFENKGEIMGCSNPHPHCQIWAGDFIPNEIYKENTQQQKYFQEKGTVLLIDYWKQEQKKKDRVVVENDSWIITVPFWAVWPFEILLLPKNHLTNLALLSTMDIKQLAEIMKKLLTAYDKLFDTSMPYSMGWHFAPFSGQKNDHWQVHAHYYPPLLRSATVKKFMVGYEMLAEPQRDITPEQAAIKLKELIWSH
ncbi:MAG TPA: UDP-glucose--hexose-1-phosphate uridylyltransferase [Chitinophagaceae bacterium]|nr:UDP-glucose--hexose-1-phosphate uridylyltransferase [Chitinophagaceae bacterium]